MSQIWIDADATPKKNKELLFKASQRYRGILMFVANRYTELPRRHNLKMKVVAQGLDKADDYIAERVEAGDLVMTADIPLAARCIEKGGHVLTPRGRELTKENIGPILSMRNVNEDLRNAGLLDGMGGGPAAFSKKDVQLFANALDRWINRSQ